MHTTTSDHPQPNTWCEDSTKKYCLKKVMCANKNLPQNALHPHCCPPIWLSPALTFAVAKLNTSSFHTLQEDQALMWQSHYATAQPAPQQWCWTVEDTMHPRLQRTRFHRQGSGLTESHINRQQCTMDAISAWGLQWLNEKDRLPFQQNTPKLQYAWRMGEVKH